MSQYDGKKVVITGGSRGIGEGIAKAFAAAGATVGVLARKDLRRVVRMVAAGRAGSCPGAARDE